MKEKPHLNTGRWEDVVEEALIWSWNNPPRPALFSKVADKMVVPIAAMVAIEKVIEGKYQNKLKPMFKKHPAEFGKLYETLRKCPLLAVIILHTFCRRHVIKTPREYFLIGYMDDCRTNENIADEEWLAAGWRSKLEFVAEVSDTDKLDLPTVFEWRGLLGRNESDTIERVRRIGL